MIDGLSQPFAAYLFVSITACIVFAQAFDVKAKAMMVVASVYTTPPYDFDGDA
jgi:hypothetical protein